MMPVSAPCHPPYESSPQNSYFLATVACFFVLLSFYQLVNNQLNKKSVLWDHVSVRLALACDCR